MLFSIASPRSMLPEAGERLTAGLAVDGGKVRAESGKVVALKP